MNFTTTPAPANPTDAPASKVGPAFTHTSDAPASTVLPISGDAQASSMDIPVLDAAASQISHAARQSQHKLDLTIGTLFLHHSPDNVLLITSTFPKEISREDAMHRFGKLLRKLRKVGSEYLWVFERGYGGHIHFHLLLVVPFDTRKGVDLDAYASIAKNRLSAKRRLVNKTTAELWDKVDQWCRDFGIGRTEVAPIYKPPGAIRNYLRKSVAHNWCYRKVAAMPDGDSDKGASWWRCSHGLTTVFGKFSFVHSPFREAVRLYAEQNGWEDLDELKENLGASWTWTIREFKESMGTEYIRSQLLMSGVSDGAPEDAVDTWDASEAILSVPRPAAGSDEREGDHHAESMIRSVDRRSGPGRRATEQETRAEPEVMRGTRSPMGTRQRGREHESGPKRRSLPSRHRVGDCMGFGEGNSLESIDESQYAITDQGIIWRGN